jgi:hypothetical protein
MTDLPYSTFCPAHDLSLHFPAFCLGDACMDMTADPDVLYEIRVMGTVEAALGGR